MENQNKWNKELLYSAIFLLAGITIFLLHPLAIINNFLALLPLNILTILSNVGVFAVISTASWVIVCLFFFSCSVYLGILSIKKAPATDQRKFFSFYPVTTNTFLAYFLVLASSFAFIGLVVALLFFTTL